MEKVIVKYVLIHAILKIAAARKPQIFLKWNTCKGLFRGMSGRDKVSRYSKRIDRVERKGVSEQEWREMMKGWEARL